jgi:hypothetical protein
MLSRAQRARISVSKALMTALATVARDILAEQFTQVRLAQRDDLGKALLAHESLGVRVHVGAACRQSHALDVAAHEP